MRDDLRAMIGIGVVLCIAGLAVVIDPYASLVMLAAFGVLMWVVDDGFWGK